MSCTQYSSLVNQRVQVTADSACVSISDCQFVNLTAAGKGGAIFFNATSGYMEVNRSSIIRCTSSDIGGAIYCSDTSFSIHTLCASQCTASNAALMYTIASGSSSFELLSSDLCAPDCVSFYGDSMDITSNDLSAKYINHTRCLTASHVAGPAIFATDSFDYEYAQFVSSYAVSHGAFYCSNPTTGSISLTNFLNNSQGGATDGLIDCKISSLVISNSIFKNGNAARIFYNGGSGTLTVSNSVISNCVGSISNGVTLNSVSFSTATTLSLEAQNCPMQTGCFSQGGYPFHFSASLLLLQCLFEC